MIPSYAFIVFQITLIVAITVRSAAIFHHPKSFAPPHLESVAIYFQIYLFLILANQSLIYLWTVSKFMLCSDVYL